MSYGPPQGNYGGPPPQQGYGYPQQGGYPPQGPPQGPPHGYPQQQQYQQGPPQHFQQGPPQGYPPQGPPPQQQGWGQPPPGQFGGPSRPSPGYEPRAAAQGDASRDADALRAAMKGFGTDRQVLINILSKPDPLQMALLRNTFNQRHHRDLEKDVKSEIKGKHDLEKALIALIRGPLMTDVHGVRDAIKGLGTKESMLTDLLVGRSNADMNAIKQAYRATFDKSLESDVKGDLSLKTEELFDMLMAARRAEETAPAHPQEIERDTSDLYAATLARNMGADQTTVSRVLTSRSDGQLRAIAHQFQQRYHQSLESAIDKRFKDHMKDALLLLVRRATDRAMTDAIQLEDAMAGLGTKDTLLIHRIVRIHWDRAHMDQVKRAYQHRYKKELIGRVKGEVDDDFERLLVACLA